MANSDKNIVITPNIGSSADDPKIVFSGADSSTGAQNITLKAYPTNNGTVSFEGSAGQLFSITNDLSGTIFSVNDVSGIPSIEVIDDGTVKIAEYSGNVLLGTGTDNGTHKLQVNGIVSATSFVGPLTGNATTATTLQNARTIGGVSFNGSANINLPGVNTTGNQNTTGSAATLTTARTITLNGDVTGSASFNGSSNITITTTVASASPSVSFNDLLNKTSGTGTYTTSGSFNAPIFYDSNNTNYRLDPSSTSILNFINLAGKLRHDGDINTYLDFPAEDELVLFAGGAENIRFTASGVLMGRNVVPKVYTATLSGVQTPDMDVFNSFVWTLSGNLTLGNPGDESVGMSGVFIFIQDATGGRTLSLGSDWESPGGSGITLSTAPGAIDIVPYCVLATNRIALGTPQLAFS
jgi:hypothetical protein